MCRERGERGGSPPRLPGDARSAGRVGVAGWRWRPGDTASSRLGDARRSALLSAIAACRAQVFSESLPTVRCARNRGRDSLIAQASVPGASQAGAPCVLNLKPHCPWRLQPGAVKWRETGGGWVRRGRRRKGGEVERFRGARFGTDLKMRAALSCCRYIRQTALHARAETKSVCVREWGLDSSPCTD